DDAVSTLAPLLPTKTQLGNDIPRKSRGPLKIDEQLTRASLELLLWCRHEQGQPQLAEQAWRALASTSPESERLLAAARTVCEAWTAAGQPDRAQALLAELARDSTLAPAALVESTWIALDAGDRDAAHRSISQAMASSPDNRDIAEACFFVAEAHFAAGDDSRALPLFQAAAKAANSPLADKALYKAGFTALRADEPATASSHFAQLVNEHPSSDLAGEAMFLTGEAAFRLDQFAAAIPWFELLLEEHPGHDVAPSCHFRLGLSLCQLERWDDAEQTLAQLARTAPNFANRNEAELWRGRALAQQGKSRPAKAALQRVVSDDQGVLAARARIALGKLSIADGQTEEALSEFLKVAVLYAHDDEVAEALVLAGQCLSALGQTDQAAARYDEVLKRYGQTPSAGTAKKLLSAL
ncbi:MAG: TolA-binding protein, partial [Pseudohongiellaceae bacterium]